MKRALRTFAISLALLLSALTSSVQYAQDANFEAGENTWTSTGVGDSVEYETLAGLGVRQEVTKIADGEVTYDHITYSVQGEEVGRKQRIEKIAEARVMGRVPEKLDVTWTKEEYPYAGGSLNCDVATWTNEGSSGAIWFSVKVPCGGIVKTLTDGEDTVWLTTWQQAGQTYVVEAPPEGEELRAPKPEPQPEPKPQPEPEPEPEPQLESEPGIEPASGYGDPITMELPERILKKMKDQGAAITRMRVYFEEDANNEDGISLEYGDMRTEVPVIYAGFKGDQCDKELTYEEWTGRQGRYVDLAVDIKTAPKRIDGMKVNIVHSHIRGNNETELSKFNVMVPEPGSPWDTFRLRGAKPGINRYSLEITYKNADGQSTTHKGFSHWVIVQAPPMFQFLNDVRVTATRSKAGENTILRGDVSMSGSFILHHGLDPDGCELRIARKGRRDLDLSDLPADVRRVIAKEGVAPGWREVARVALSDGMIGGREVVTVEDQFVKIDYQHVLSATDKVLPLIESWEYHFELYHDASPEPLATWTVSVGLEIKNAGDIAKAKLKVRATGVDEPVSVPFSKS